jgi:hypothetical protein
MVILKFDSFHDFVTKKKLFLLFRFFVEKKNFVISIFLKKIVFFLLFQFFFEKIFDDVSKNFVRQLGKLGDI